MRFRKDHPVVAGSVRVRPDIVFTAAHLVIFVDGCFWHCCPVHGRPPRANPAYWGPKLAANRARDRRVEEALRATGWVVLRVWEHTPVEEATDLVSGWLARVQGLPAARG